MVVDATRRTAYSYVRFSSPQQAAGDSYRRQTERAEAYCARRGWTLSTANYQDLGVSAFRGKNALVGNLGEFLKAITEGRVAAGSVLIVENVDRISRQGIDEGYDLIKRILKAGVILVTLSPEREYDASATKRLTAGALELQIVLERAAEESQTKSDRIGEVWKKRRKDARGRVPKAMFAPAIPAWCRRAGGEVVLDPAKASAVRRIFELAAAGYGTLAITKKLVEECVPPIGRKPRWIKGYVGKVLRNRAAMGECQPKAGGKPDGPALPHFYPAVVTEQEFYAARAGMTERRPRVGRKSKGPMNLFVGTLRDARDGGNLILQGQVKKGDRTAPMRYLLVSNKAERGQGPSRSFPYLAFQGAVLSRLREIDPTELLGPSEADLVDALRGELAEVRGRLAEIAAELNSRDRKVAVLADAAAQLEERERELLANIERAKGEAARPLAECWAEVRNLADALADAPDQEDAHLRLRSALRRAVEAAWLLVVPRGKVRLAVVQFHFRDGGRRDYLIHHRGAHNIPGKGTRPARTTVESLADAGLEGGLDLRDPDHVARLEAALAEVPLVG